MAPKIKISNTVFLLIEVKLFAPFTHQNGFNEEFFKGVKMGSRRVQVSGGKFPQVSDPNFEGGMFVGLRIRELLRDQSFKQVLIGSDIAACEAFEGIVHGFMDSFEQKN